MSQKNIKFFHWLHTINSSPSNSYLNLAFDENGGIRKQDVARVFSSVASNKEGQDVAWEYLQENFLQMATYTQSFSTAGGFVEDATYTFNTRQQLQELEDFRAQYASILGNADRAVDRSIQRTMANIEWVDSYYDTIAAIFEP